MVVGQRRVRFDCAAGSPLIAELAKMPQVSSVDLYQIPELSNTFVRQAIGIAPPAAPPLPWDGSGVLVGVADGGVDADHPDLKGRIEKVIHRVDPGPGTVVLSARSGGSFPRYPFAGFDGRYTFLSGTSMATPAVAGAAAIVRQYYVQERQHPPSAALLKATLVNGAAWMPGELISDPSVGQPNFHQGFGRLDLRRTLPVPGDPGGLKLVFADVDRASDQALKREIEARSFWKRTLQVEAGLPLRVTLAWTDRPDHGLQQSLDLVVVSPSARRLPGNPRLVRAPGQKSDHFNNLQQVVVEEPEPGGYVIQILAYNTLYEAQGFSLVATGKLASDLLP